MTRQQTTAPAERCALCDEPLTPPTIKVRAGGACHLDCAERAAAMAWRRRRALAVAHLGLMAAVLGGLALRGVATPAWLAVALAWAALHARLHQRYWYHITRQLRRSTRRRRR